MIWFAYLLIGISAFILAYEFFKFGAAQKGGMTAGEKVIVKTPLSKSLILRLSMPFIRAYILPSVKNLNIENFRKTMKKKISSAGIQDEISPDELFSLKILLAIGIPFIAFIYNLGLQIANPFLLIVIFATMGYFFPDLWIRGMIKDRQQKIRLAIPFVVDLLSLCTEAGLDFMAAIQRVVRKAKKSPLIDELEYVLAELKLGTTRAEGLRNMANRVEMPEVSSLVAVLVTADQMGASISGALKSQSEQIRSERFIRAEKTGAAASQKILFPLIFFIVPAVFIVVLGPLVARLLQQLFTGGFGGAGGGFF